MLIKQCLNSFVANWFQKKYKLGLFQQRNAQEMQYHAQGSINPFGLSWRNKSGLSRVKTKSSKSVCPTNFCKIFLDFFFTALLLIYQVNPYFLQLVIFLNESTIVVLDDRVQTVGRRQGEKFEPQCLKKTIKFSQKIMVCDSISIHGNKPLIHRGWNNERWKVYFCTRKTSFAVS